ncbi:MAG: polysaccharide pyruvyl transferase family protein [Chloroflexota bacterium]|nr:MAG: polysaccharide pyruvyl transferase family protein [Chloroflexota bacterium]
MVKNRDSYKIGISGSYGGLNLGDEAILHVMVTQLRKALPVEITVFSRNAKDTLQRHQVERAVAVRDLTREEVTSEIEKLDLFILGGGGILYDAEARIYLRELDIAQRKSIATMTYAIGIGPLNDPTVQKQVHDILGRVNVITVRERSDARLLEDIGIHREIIVTADPALLLKPEPLPEGALSIEHMEGKRHLVGMSVREAGIAAPDIDEQFYHVILANAADFMIDRFDADIVFFPMEQRMLDVQHSHAVISQMLRPQRVHVLKGEYTPGQLLSLVRYCDFVVGMRLHFLIFAALQKVPFVALPYSTKVVGLLNALQVEMPPINLVNAGRLIAYIDRSWDRRNTLKERIKSILPSMKKEALKPNRLAMQLLSKKHMEYARATKAKKSRR